LDGSHSISVILRLLIEAFILHLRSRGIVVAVGGSGQGGNKKRSVRSLKGWNRKAVMAHGENGSTPRMGEEGVGWSEVN